MGNKAVHRINGWVKCKTITGQAKSNSEKLFTYGIKNKCSEHIWSRMFAKENAVLLGNWGVKGILERRTQYESKIFTSVLVPEIWERFQYWFCIFELFSIYLKCLIDMAIRKRIQQESHWDDEGTQAPPLWGEAERGGTAPLGEEKTEGDQWSRTQGSLPTSPCDSLKFICPDKKF